LGALLLAAGVVVGTLGYAANTGPAGVVRGYVAALLHGDAAEALAYGNVPFGPRMLLTAAVLREQHRIAPIRGVSVVSTERHGSSATVRGRYTLAYRAKDVPVSVDVPLHERCGDWRLDYAAIPTGL